MVFEKKNKDIEMTTKFLDGGAARMGLSLMDIGKTFCVCVIFVLNIF